MQVPLSTVDVLEKNLKELIGFLSKTSELESVQKELVKELASDTVKHRTCSIQLRTGTKPQYESLELVKEFTFV